MTTKTDQSTKAHGNVVGEILNVSGGATMTSANPWAGFFI